MENSRGRRDVNFFAVGDSFSSAGSSNVPIFILIGVGISSSP
jgi:hypothetical protein